MINIPTNPNIDNYKICGSMPVVGKIENPTRTPRVDRKLFYVVSVATFGEWKQVRFVLLVLCVSCLHVVVLYPTPNAMFV